jgi:protocatechuate 3,4-dioxygenase beta subunit
VSDVTNQNVNEALLNEVLASFDDSRNSRLVEILRSAVKHLHAFVEETNLTRDEWMTGIDFLTDTGKKSINSRQEFILLSDTLGVSMLVELVNQKSTVNATDPTVLGPFYIPDSPMMEMNSFIGSDDEGADPLTVTGIVQSTNGDLLGDAIIEVWQVAPNGLYDVQDVDVDAPNYRARFQTCSDGRFSIRTSKPIDYQIPTDGPVGTMLTETGRSSWRPAHIHFRVSCPGHKTLVTHVFDASSRYLESDAVFGVMDSLKLEMSGDEASFDFVLDEE